MLTRLIPTPTAEHRRGTNQVRQQVTIREHFRRRNALKRYEYANSRMVLEQ
jgi:hypothetical protein